MLAPLVELVDEVEAVDVDDVDPGIPMQVPPTLITVQEPLPLEEELEDEPLLDEPLLDELLDELVSIASATPSTMSVTGLEPDPDEELLVPGSSADRTSAVATPCQTMPTSIIPAATAAIRLTVVRRPGLISTLFPSN
ncbi:hypothetical protein [Actinomycetospora sp. CA-084318]|uniref:hypothetical protein n=1 Tax=Actinomycetospora sp. CA-084318 TaxID=3239892 RepID=UPI003D977F75